MYKDRRRQFKVIYRPGNALLPDRAPGNPIMTGADSIPGPAGGVQWRGAAAYRPLAERLDRALRSGEGTVVKATRVRTVLRLEAAGWEAQPVLLKVYRGRGPGARLRTLLFGPSAEREARTLQHLARAGVSVPIPLLTGTEGAARLSPRSYLALALLKEACSLEEILLGRHAPPVSRTRLAHSLGLLVRALHEAGTFHGDLHAGNILVDPEGRLVLIDLHGARRFQRLPPRKRTLDLLSLAPAFMVHATRAERHRFFRAYRAVNGRGLSPPLRVEAQGLEKACRERLRHVLAKMDRRPLRPGRHFQRISLYELQGMGERSERTAALLRFLGPHPEERLEEKGRRAHRSGRTRVYAVRVDETAYSIKIYKGRSGAAAPRNLLPGSRGRRAWVNYHRLRFRGLPVPDPVLYLEESIFSATGRSLVATTWAEGHQDLNRFLQGAPLRIKRRVLLRLAWYTARFHRLFLANRDLKAENILVSPSGALLFVDPDGVEPIFHPSFYVMARDLMRLNASFRPPYTPVSASDRRRFLRAYGLHMGLGRREVRTLWWEVLRLTWDKWIRWEETARGTGPTF